MSERDRKNFIKVFKKFGDPKRIPDAMRDTEVADISAAEVPNRRDLCHGVFSPAHGLYGTTNCKTQLQVPNLEELAKKLLEECKKRKEEMRDDVAEATSTLMSGAGAKPKDPLVIFCGLKVNAIELLKRRKDMQFLQKQVRARKSQGSARPCVGVGPTPGGRGRSSPTPTRSPSTASTSTTWCGATSV